MVYNFQGNEDLEGLEVQVESLQEREVQAGGQSWPLIRHGGPRPKVAELENPLIWVKKLKIKWIG